MRFAGVLLFLSVAILAISAKPIKTGKPFRIPFTVVDHNTTLGLRRRSTARIPLKSFKEKIWKGTVGFGTPQQQLTVIFDTGSADSWVADADCGNCETLPTYNMGNSGTAEDTEEEFECQYSDGDEIKGTWTRDTVTLQNVPFEEQAFVRATQVPESIKTNGYSGLIGLGFSALCDNEDMTPLIQTLEETAELDSGLISCRFVKDNTEQAGELLFGAVENQYVDGNIVYIPLVRSFNKVTDWAVRVVGLASQGKSMPQRRIPTIVDTGGSTINVTPDVASWLYSGITGAKLVDSTWYIPDPFPSDVTFDFEQAKFSVPAADMLLREEPKNGDLYAAAIQGYAGESWVVGQPFIKNHYVVFNYGARTLGIGKRRDP